MKGTLREVCISLLGAAAAGSLILGLTRLIQPLGTQELVAIWVVGVALVCMYPLLRTNTGAAMPPGTVLVGATGLLILSNSPTDYLVVPACLILALLALRTLPDMAPMKAPLSLALAGATLDLAGGLFWLTGQPTLKELSWWGSAVGGALVFAGFALAAARPLDRNATGRGYKLANLALAVAALGVAGGWMAEALWELIGRVLVPYQDAYVASVFPTEPWVGTLTGASYLTVAVGLLLLMYTANRHKRQPAEASDAAPRVDTMREVRSEWSRAHRRRAVARAENPSATRDVWPQISEKPT